MTPDLNSLIKTLGAYLSELISMKLYKQIDESINSREYQRISREITDLQIKKDEIVSENLESVKDVSRMQAVKK